MVAQESMRFLFIYFLPFSFLGGWEGDGFYDGSDLAVKIGTEGLRHQLCTKSRTV